jgi:hypothetical protein
MTLTRKIQLTALIAGLSIALSACGSKPEVVQSVKATNVSTAGVKTPVDSKSQVHEVVVNDVLHAEKYTYLDVTENGKQFWVAVPRKEVEKGETYYYVGGLLKKNFKSREYDRVFETIYLVSDVRKDPIFTGNASVAQALSKVGGEAGHIHDQDVRQTGEGVSLEELFNNKEKYAGKEIQVSGKCVKINKQIMGRNWVHIQDGTGGEKPYDLTVTTSADVPVGTAVTFTGKIALNVDFGAGYRYDIIMQEAHIH